MSKINIKIPSLQAAKLNLSSKPDLNSLGRVSKQNGGVTMPRDWSRLTSQQLADLRSYVDDQKKAVGVSITTQAGLPVTVNLNVPTVGKLLLGFGFVTVVPDGVVSIALNNLLFVDGVNGGFFNVANLNKEYYEYFYPLAGTDKLKITVTDAAGGKVVQFAMYYI